MSRFLQRRFDVLDVLPSFCATMVRAVNIPTWFGEDDPSYWAARRDANLMLFANCLTCGATGRGGTKLRVCPCARRTRMDAHKHDHLYHQFCSTRCFHVAWRSTHICPAHPELDITALRRSLRAAAAASWDEGTLGRSSRTLAEMFELSLPAEDPEARGAEADVLPHSQPLFLVCVCMHARRTPIYNTHTRTQDAKVVEVD